MHSRLDRFDQFIKVYMLVYEFNEAEPVLTGKERE